MFLEAWHAAAYDPQRGSVRTWIMIRARSQALDRRRKLAREAAGLDAELVRVVELAISRGCPSRRWRRRCTSRWAP